MALMDFFRKKSSGDVAKDRLKLLLISDRANCSPEVMELIKNVLSRLSQNIWRSTVKIWTSRLPRPNPTGRTAMCRPCAPIFRLRI